MIFLQEAYAYYLTKKSSLGEDGIFKNLPKTLLIELINDAYSKEIKQLRIFDDCDSSFISDIYMYTRPFKVQRGQVLYRIGDLANDIILICKGHISISSFRGKKEVMNGISTTGGIDYFIPYFFINL